MRSPDDPSSGQKQDGEREAGGQERRLPENGPRLSPYGPFHVVATDGGGPVARVAQTARCERHSRVSPVLEEAHRGREEGQPGQEPHPPRRTGRQERGSQAERD